MRSPMDLINPLMFSLLVALMFPIGLGSSPQTLSQLAPGLIWVIVLLASMLSADKLFKQDFIDGSLSLYMLSPQSSYLLVSVKVLVHWFGNGLSLLLLSPLLAILLHLPLHILPGLVVSLLVGSLSLVYVAAIGSALTVGLRQSGVLITVIILPLYVPILILGVATVQSAALALPYLPYLALMAALAIFVMLLAPLAITAGLRINLDA